MNPEKLKKLQGEVRLGGKGTARRKKKVVHKTATTDDKKLQIFFNILLYFQCKKLADIN